MNVLFYIYEEPKSVPRRMFPIVTDEQKAYAQALLSGDWDVEGHYEEKEVTPA